MIFGFDLSTTTIGYTILNNDGSYHDISFIDLSKIDNFYKKVDIFRNFLYKIIKDYGIDDNLYFVETPLLAHSLTMLKTIGVLQRFNACCCYSIYEILLKEPTLINVISARSLLKIKVPKGLPKKDRKPFVWQSVKNLGIIPSDKWLYKKTGKPQEKNFDMADAFIIAKAGILQVHE